MHIVLSTSPGHVLTNFVNLFLVRNCSNTVLPKFHDIPLSDSTHPSLSVLGVAHKRSQSNPNCLVLYIVIELPESGQSVGRTILVICDTSFRSGEIPPWTQNNSLSIIDTRGRQLNTSLRIFQVLMFSFRLPKMEIGNKRIIVLHSS
jgi:hypothetical protein